MMRSKNKNMDVVILCGGAGTRLREETRIKPKPMIGIGSKPILWHIMKYYSCFGFRRFILALGYKGGCIKEYFDSRSAGGAVMRENGWDVVCVDTGVNTLKGGRIKRMEKHIRSDSFHLTYGDGLGTVDLDALTSFHRSHKRVGTVTSVHPPSRFGEMLIAGNRVVEFEEKPQLTSGYINGGFFIFNRALLEYLTPDKNCDLEFGALQKLCRDKELMAYRHEGYWQCMDTWRDMQYLNRLWKSGRAPWKIWKK